MPPALEKKGLKKNWSFLKIIKQITKVIDRKVIDIIIFPRKRTEDELNKLYDEDTSTVIVKKNHRHHQEKGKKDNGKKEKSY